MNLQILENHQQSCFQLCHMLRRLSLASGRSIRFPTVSKQAVIKQIEKLHDIQANLVKNRNKPELAAKWAETRKSLDELFDIAACKCYDKAADNTDIQKIRQNYKCPFQKKFKLVEWKHYCDIKQGREIVIGSIDTRETRLIQERSARKGRDQPAVQRSNSDPFASSVEDLVVEDQSGEDDDDRADDDIRDPSFKPEKPEKVTNQHAIPNLAMVSDRFGLSNYAAAAVCNAYMKDLGLLNPSTETCSRAKFILRASGEYLGWCFVLVRS